VGAAPGFALRSCCAGRGDALSAVGMQGYRFSSFPLLPGKVRTVGFSHVAAVRGPDPPSTQAKRGSGFGPKCWTTRGARRSYEATQTLTNPDCRRVRVASLVGIATKLRAANCKGVVEATVSIALEPAAPGRRVRSIPCIDVRCARPVSHISLAARRPQLPPVCPSGGWGRSPEPAPLRAMLPLRPV